MHLRSLVLSSLVAAPLAAQPQPPRVTEGDWTARDFRFASGETLPELRLHYRTLGRPRRRGLGVNHLRLVLGTSMGCMHAWMWGEAYPGFVDGLAPFACAPTQIAGRNRMIRTMIMDDIRNDPAWQGGNYTAPPPGLRAALQLLYIMSSAPLVQHAQAPTRDAADSVIRRYLDDRFRATDANDMLYQFDASRDYDPSGALGAITARVLAINSADDFVNPPELGVAERLVGTLPNVRFVLVPTGPETRGHGTHTRAAVWKGELARFLAALPALPGR